MSTMTTKPYTRRVQFRDVAVGQSFNSAAVGAVTSITFLKVSPGKAVSPEHSVPFNVKPSTPVDALVGDECTNCEHVTPRLGPDAGAPHSCEDVLAAKAARRLQWTRAKLEGYRDNGRKAAEKMAQALLASSNDAHYALRWATGTFEFVALGCVAEQLLDALDKGTTLDVLRDECLRRALQGARSPEHSTSLASNMMAEYTTAAWAKLADEVVRG